MVTMSQPLQAARVRPIDRMNRQRSVRACVGRVGNPIGQMFRKYDDTPVELAMVWLTGFEPATYTSRIMLCHF